MNKAELIEQVATEAGISKAQANAAMDAFTSAIGNALRDGDRVTLVGFGTFSVSERAARNGRNPQTGATIKIAARRVPRFKAGKEFASALSGNGKSGGGSKKAAAGSKAAGASKGAASKASGAASKATASKKSAPSKAAASKGGKR